MYKVTLVYTLCRLNIYVVHTDYVDQATDNQTVYSLVYTLCSTMH